MKKNLIALITLLAVSPMLLANDDPTILGGDLSQGIWYDTIDGQSEISGPFRNYETGANNVTRQQALQINTQALDQWKAGGAILGPSQRPDTSDRRDCAQMLVDDAGLWENRDCWDQLRLACFNGFDWKISNRSPRFGDDKGNGGTESNNNMQDTYAACLEVADDDGVVGNYRFSAPVSYVQNQNLQRVAQSAGQNRIWINLQDKKYEGVWKFNLESDVLAPFWNVGEPNNSGDCAQFYGNSGKWDDTTCNQSKKVACYDPQVGNNGDWKVTANGYPFTDNEALNQQCQKEFGSTYKFFSPVTLSQNTALRSRAGNNNIWINASDRLNEGIWKRNVELNDWESGQPLINNTELCVSAEVQNSGPTTLARWRARSCSDVQAVACTSGGRWYFSTQTTSLDNFADGQAVCDTLRSGYVFSAPKNQIQIESLAFFARQAGVTGTFWINGNRIADKNSGLDDWQWNVRDLNVPNWNNGEPNGLSGENCAVLNGTGNGWADTRCDAGNRGYLCRNGSDWRVSAATGDLADFSAGALACQAEGSGWTFAAPETYNENLAAQAAIGNAAVWINATDNLQEATWLLNASAITQFPNWAATQPDNGGVAPGSASGREDCVYQSGNGEWFDTSCLAASQYPWACSNGSQWRVTKAVGSAQNIADGYKACFREYGADYIFAAPLSVHDETQLDFARLLANQERGTAGDNVWLNVNDGGEDSSSGAINEWRFNLPFVNWQQNPYPGREPADNLANICVFKESADAGENNPWRLQNCISGSAHYACFDGSRWNIARSQGVLNNGVREIIPTEDDYWSVERADALCKSQFGRSYYFSVPVTGAEELALDATIRAFDAQQKRVWINYYRLADEIRDSANNRWFANRLKTGVWQQPQFNNFNGADCTVIHADGSWSDMNCSDRSVGRYACFTGEWTIIEEAGGWLDGFRYCDERGANALFAVPRNPTELNELLQQLDNNGGDKVWVNMNDRDLEAQWIVNKPRVSFWGVDEPSNRGNRDCALARADGSWFSAKCSVQEARFACRILADGVTQPQWRVTQSTGVWSQGFAACQREFSDLGKAEFYSAVAFGATSARDNNTLIASAIGGGDPVWINFSDQGSEGAWRPHAAFDDWGAEELIDEPRDCGYLDREVAGNGTWYADTCSGSQPRLYACTNGYEWRLVNSDTSDTGWLSGFTACQTLNDGSQSRDWYFAAPTNEVDNAKLRLAMELQGSGGVAQVWINAQDALEEGSWTINGDKINYPIEIALTVEAGNGTLNTVSDNQVREGDRVRLTFDLSDAEGELIDLAGFAAADAAASIALDVVNIEYVSNGMAAPSTVSAITLINRSASGGAAVPVGASQAQLVAEFDAPTLFTHDMKLTLQLTAQDTAPAAADAAVSQRTVVLIIKAPLAAAYDFNDAQSPSTDITGNQHDAYNSQTYPLPDVVNGALQLSATETMRVAGIATDSSNGLALPADEYVVMFRMSVEQAHDGDGNSAIRSIFQKGNSANERQPAMFLFGDSERLYGRSSTSSDALAGNASVDGINLQQWLNVFFVKRSNGYDVYINDITTPFMSYDYPAGQSGQANDGDFWFGASPAQSESFVGLIDDIYLFNRRVDLVDLNGLLPAPPVGEVSFVDFATNSPEYDSNTVVDISLQRLRGQRGQLDAYVQIIDGTASFSNSAETTLDGNPLDLAFVDYSSSGSVSGAKVSWNDGETGPRNIQLRIDSADDGDNEGTETARLEIVALDTPVSYDAASDVTVGAIAEHSVALEDLTPNADGNFSVWAITRGPGGVINRSQRIVRNEGGSGEICIFRDSGSEGDVTINYDIVSDLAEGTDYSFNAQDGANQTAIQPSGSSGSVLFADNGAANETVQCFHIELNNISNDSDYFDDDTPIFINLTGISRSAQASGAVLTQQRQAQLDMREVAQGVFGFTNEFYRCDENGFSGIAQCGAIAIQRQRYARYADAATLSFTVEQASAFDNTGTPTAWTPVATDTDFTPVLTSSNAEVDFVAIDPSNLAANQQDWTIAVNNDNDQEDLEEVFRVTIDPSIGSVADSSIPGLYGSAIITVGDDTEAAVVEVNTSDSNVLMGQAMSYQIDRSGNQNTEFSAQRVVEYINSSGDAVLPFGCRIEDFVTGIADQPLQFNKGAAAPSGGGLSAKHTLRGNDPYKLRVSVKDADPKRVVHFDGVPSQQSSFEVFDVSVNPAARQSLLVPNGIANASQVDQGSAEPATNGTNSFYAITAKLALRTRISISYTLPTGAEFNGCSSGFLKYRWSVSDSGNRQADSEFVVDAAKPLEDSVAVPAINGQTLTVEMDLPYTYTNDVTSTVTLDFEYVDSATSPTPTIYGTYSKNKNIVTKPRWRQLRNVADSGDCLRWDSTDNLFQDPRYETSTCGSYQGQSSDYTLWTYDPMNNLMRNKGGNLCATGNGNLVRTSCGSADKWRLTNDGNYFRIYQNSGSEFWCHILTSDRIDVRGGSCTGNDPYWFWGADQ